MEKLTLESPVLESCELFVGLSTSAQSDALACSTMRSFKRRDVIAFTGDAACSVLLLVEGCVKLTQLTESGNEVILRLHAPGEVLGLPGWWPGDKHSSTAQALQPSAALAWEPETFQTLLEKHPQMQRNAIEIIQRRLHALEHRYCVVSQARVAVRLAHGLSHAFEQLGQKMNGNVVINLTQEELGQMVAMSSFEVSRVLSMWERQGLVKLGRELIEVRNLPRVMALCKVS